MILWLLQSKNKKNLETFSKENQKTTTTTTVSARGELVFIFL